MDFSRPFYTGVSELVVTAKDVPEPQSIDDLAGEEVVVRRSSSYYESLEALNRSLVGRGLAPARLIAADERLEDEDLLEMVKYGDQYDELNRALFAFAAYNAGPTRISQFRRAAARRGLNPNQWFFNVERIASERIGRETVEYVANIFKYYFAYLRVDEQRRMREGLRIERISQERQDPPSPQGGERGRLQVLQARTVPGL